MKRPLPVRLVRTVALMLTACVLSRRTRAARSPIRVAVDTVTADALSRIAWQAMTRECSRIWAREGVELLWLAAEPATPPAPIVLPVVFDDRELSRQESQKGAALGVTSFIGRSQRIVVSVPRAQQIITARSELAKPSNVLQREIALGVLMGRVVAHEIGHALLRAPGHSPRGLMRRSSTWAKCGRPGTGSSPVGRRAPAARRALGGFDPVRPDRPVGLHWADAPPAPSRRRAQR
jgi:hypothetical protein